MHYYCMLFSCGLAQQEDIEEGIIGFRLSDIQQEYRRGRRLKCSYCKKVGGTIGCYHNTCRKSFHLPCGLKNNSLHQFFGVFKSYCEKHRPVQPVPPEEQSDKLTLCPICLDNVESKVTYNTLRANCCKTSWFHRSCLQKQALSAGYFFRCPLCNNCDEFKSEMKTYGIYIPEKDAAWELEQNAYRELLFRYSQCDASLCLCPKGRKFKSKNQWNVILCNTCGSKGCHRRCGMINDSVMEWECDDCQSVRTLVPTSEKRKQESQGRLESEKKRKLMKFSSLHNNKENSLDKNKMTKKLNNALQLCIEETGLDNSQMNFLENLQRATRNSSSNGNCLPLLSNNQMKRRQNTRRRHSIQVERNGHSTIKKPTLSQNSKITRVKSKSFSPKCCSDCKNSKNCIKYLIGCLQPISVHNKSSSSCSLS
ncbi:G2/M phase-specific E3 ubiquitin-protein ligase-like [Centruroides sculpturatus]|uniref:G2/M phase-specific E3 ubiquitin-protein ligase-like n=1 Tax=Centruroides sculpturatus TaxID=218467 RepID=UPI000C6D3C33|nr:G2/M phase-specific E3 ubiquitin-protein ligase-like [Centruroides sculpturatus]